MSCSTSLRSSASPAQAVSRNAERSAAVRSSASAKTRSTLCHRSGSIIVVLASSRVQPFGLQRGVEPGLGAAPLAADGLLRDPELAGDLFVGEAGGAAPRRGQ